MREIPLSQGKTAIVDDEDFERVNQFKWYAAKQRNNSFYAMRRNPATDRLLPMPRFILGVTDPKCEIDHINHDTLDNRRENLRVCTPRQNQQNLRNKKSKLPTGVFKVTGCKSYFAHINIGGKLRHLGSFKTEAEAEEAYKSASRSLGIEPFC